LGRVGHQDLSNRSPDERSDIRGDGALRNQWQLNSKNRSIPVLEIYLSIVRLNDRAGDRKTHAHAVVLGRKKWLKYLWYDFRGHAWSRVLYTDLGKLPVLSRRHRHGALSAWCIQNGIHRIENKVGYDLLQLDRIAIDSERHLRRLASHRDLA
jgi:hypothetical protein